MPLIYSPTYINHQQPPLSGWVLFLQDIYHYFHEARMLIQPLVFLLSELMHPAQVGLDEKPDTPIRIPRTPQS